MDRRLTMGWIETLKRWDVDRAVAYAVAQRVWQFPAGLLTTIVIALCFSPTEQGFFYTLTALIALQALADLGLQWVILHFASHEWADLQLDDRGRLQGKPSALLRLAGLAQRSQRIFVIAAAAFVVVIGGLGLILFSLEDSDITWLGPWLLVVLFSGGSLLLIPRLAVLEGCHQVRVVNRTRLFQAVTGHLTIWCAIIGGAGLWAAAASSAVQLGWESWLVGVRYRPFWKSLPHETKASPEGIDWKGEVWPLQWRIGLQSVFRYFAFYLFVPVMWTFHGAEEAGRMGMSWTILMNIQLAAFAWVRTRAPLFGTLVANRDFAELDRRFFRVLSISVVFLLAGLAAFCGLIALLSQHPHPWLRSFGGRFLPPWAICVFAVGLVMLHVAQCLAVYIRAHKKDPLWGLIVGANATLGLAVFVLGGHYGVLGAAYSFFAVVTFITLPGTLWIWRLRRDLWRPAAVPT